MMFYINVLMIYIDFTTIVTTAMYAFHTKDNKQQWLS